MLQAVWFDAGREASGRLLLVIHHLAVDGVSWRILLPDLEAAVTAAVRGETPALPAAGTSFRRWAQALATEAQSAERLAELPLWTAMQDAPALSLFDGALDRARDVTGSARELTLTLPPAVTGALLTRVAAAFHAGINDVLLTALALAVVDWCRRRGRGGDAAMPCWWMSRATAARSSAPAAQGSICRARSAGSPASTRYGSIRALLDLDARAVGRRRHRRGAQGHQGAVARAARPRAGLRAAALSQPADRSRACAACRRRRSASTIWGGSRRPAAADWASAPEAVPLGGGDPALALAHAIEINALTLDGADGPSLARHLDLGACAHLRRDGARPGAGLVPGA